MYTLLHERSEPERERGKEQEREIEIESLYWFVWLRATNLFGGRAVSQHP